MDLPSTGERLVTSIDAYYAIEHLHRYALALELAEGRKVLDIACGEGYGSNLLSDVADSVIGIDISTETIKHAEKEYRKNNLKFIQGDVCDVNVPNNSVDLVVSFETIEHHDKHKEMFNEIKRVLKKNGMLIMSSPDKQYYSDTPRYKNHYHVRELYFNEFKDLGKQYFKNIVFLLQKSFYGSLIVPEFRINTGNYYKEFIGNYDKINDYSRMESPIYNICIASDSVIPENKISIFLYKDALELNNEIETLRKYKNEIDKVKASIAYKLGILLTMPYRKFKKIIRTIGKYFL